MKKKLEELFKWPTDMPTVPKDNHHWFGEANKEVLNGLIDELNPKLILELGSWTGAGSTSFILNKAPNAHLICIDHWGYDLSVHTKQNAWDSTPEEINRMKTLWETFLVNTWDHKNHLTPIRNTTIDGLKLLELLDVNFDLIYIDAHHDYESVLYDIEESLRLWPDAIICGDDYRWPDGGVAKAVDECATKYNFELAGLDQCWYYNKK
jgi:predicted O-methyltransferase YrrM